MRWHLQYLCFELKFYLTPWDPMNQWKRPTTQAMPVRSDVCTFNSQLHNSLNSLNIVSSCWCWGQFSASFLLASCDGFLCWQVWILLRAVSPLIRFGGQHFRNLRKNSYFMVTALTLTSVVLLLGFASDILWTSNDIHRVNSLEKWAEWAEVWRSPCTF